MMNRRDFIKHLALLTAATATLPEIVLEYEKSITINAIKNVDTGLIFVDEINICGMAGYSSPMAAKFITNGMDDLDIGLNLFGGIYRWVAMPGHALRLTTMKDLKMQFMGKGYGLDIDRDLYGGLRFIDQNGLYQFANFNYCKFDVDETGKDNIYTTTLDTCSRILAEQR